eukprot:9150019-Heterocapsa_arctica.AAC.1
MARAGPVSSLSAMDFGGMQRISCTPHLLKVPLYPPKDYVKPGPSPPARSYYYYYYYYYYYCTTTTTTTT